jgi:hypothetical protein
MLIIIDLSYIMYNDLWMWNKWNEMTEMVISLEQNG